MAATNRPCFMIGTQITARMAVISYEARSAAVIRGSIVAVGHDVRLARPHQPKALLAELPERVAADDAVDAVGVIAGQQERVFVLLDRGVGAAVDGEMLAQRARGRQRDRFSVGELSQPRRRARRGSGRAPRASCGERCPAPPSRRRQSAPEVSRIGETVSEMSIRRPSLATRTVSKCSIGSPRTMRARISLLFIEALRWDQHRDRLPDGFSGGVSEQTLSAFVPGKDDALKRLADDGVL